MNINRLAKMLFFLISINYYVTKHPILKWPGFVEMTTHLISIKTGNTLFEMENCFVLHFMYNELIRSVGNSFRCLVHHVCHVVNQFDESRLSPLRCTVLHSMIIPATVSCIACDEVPNELSSSVVD
jgi:hypothetical protein